MAQKIFDIPFRTRSLSSDFSCPDGETAYIKGAKLLSSGPAADSHLLPEYADENLSDNVSDITPRISFALVRDTLKGWHTHPNLYPSATLAISESSLEYLTPLASQLLEAFQTQTRQHNLFVAPFLVTAVWKTISGSYMSPSSVSLMIPNNDVPLVASDAGVSSDELTFRIAGAVCSLRLKMKASELLRDWVGVIDSLEILVSSPLQYYNSFHSFLPQRRVTTDAWCRSLDLETGEIADRRICTDTLPLAWKAVVKGKLTSAMIQDDYHPGHQVLKGLKFYTYASIPLSEVDRLEEWSGAESGIGNWHPGIQEEISFESIINSSAFKSRSYYAIIEGIGEEIDFETRPLKLSGAGEFKMAGKVFLRGKYNPDSITLSVYASRDMMKWWCISKRKGATMAILPHSSFRFYKIRIQGHLPIGQNLQGLSIE